MSSELNNIEILRHADDDDAVLVWDYMIRLQKLTQSVVKYWREHPNRIFDQDLSELQLVVHKYAILTKIFFYVLP